MLGLGIGSWFGSYLVQSKQKLFVRASAISVYGIIECFISTGAFLVPSLFNVGAHLCEVAGEMNSWLYLLSSALIIVLAILPFAIAMGATYPVILEFLREDNKTDQRSFGFLYTANTAGAWMGAILTVFILIEILGFKRVLAMAAICNFLIGLTSLIWGRSVSGKLVAKTAEIDDVPTALLTKNTLASLILFSTGFCSMAMEVVWNRLFTPFLGNMVYSFASLLAAYLACNWIGAFLYRSSLARNKVISVSCLLKLTCLTSLLPLVASNPNWVQQPILIIMSIMPFSAMLGYLTPLIVDDTAKGIPSLAGKAYAINILGCVLGPLFAGYLLITYLGARISLILLVMPLLLLVLFTKTEEKRKFMQLAASAFTILASITTLLLAFTWLSGEEGGHLKPDDNKIIIHRDFAATTISCTKDQRKLLLVNGGEMTILTPVTKIMAHLPLALCGHKPKSVLVICFGMGSTFRSSLAWDCDVTAVELVPGVIKAFDYYYPDAKTILDNTNGHVVIDDGRRFLQRTNKKFDVIIIDPPPPLQASTSGLLHSKEFLHLVKDHLNPGGIFQEWFLSTTPWHDVYLRAFLRSVKEVFPYTRIFPASYDPSVRGFHIISSNQPIPSLSAESVYSSLPEKAKADLMETVPSNSGFNANPKEQLRQLLADEISIDKELGVREKAIKITDDYPYNEYFLLQLVLNKQVYLMP